MEVSPVEQTQVAIVGAGPAGLVLSHLLARAGVESVVLECRSRQYVERRVRAGVLEAPTVKLLQDLGVADRLRREGLPHHGLSIRFDGADQRIALTELTGRHITVYGQQEVVKDLIAARLAAGLPIVFDASDVVLHDLETDKPRVTYRDAAGVARELRCGVVAGCDGFHGVSRPSVPHGALTVYEHSYPYAWLGVLAKAAPSHEELIYAFSDRGFALHSMRSPEITRLYLQVPAEERMDAWPDERIWSELDRRLASDGFALNRGPVLEKGITAMRSFVVEPLRYGRLFLAGDAAHIVPPTGAKGMNLAIADVAVLARALTRFFATGRDDLLDAYSETCLRRIWRAEHFSWWMTTTLHLAPDQDPFARQLQRAQLRYLTSSVAARTSLAENYVGLPFESEPTR
jgi:p-hydroxybenzoate 3-monooxygenase